MDARAYVHVHYIVFVYSSTVLSIHAHACCRRNNWPNISCFLYMQNMVSFRNLVMGDKRSSRGAKLGAWSMGVAKYAHPRREKLSQGGSNAPRPLKQTLQN